MTSNGGGGDVKTKAGDTNILLRLRDQNVMRNAGPRLITSGTVYDADGETGTGRYGACVADCAS